MRLTPTRMRKAVSAAKWTMAVLALGLGTTRVFLAPVIHSVAAGPVIAAVGQNAIQLGVSFPEAVTSGLTWRLKAAGARIAMAPGSRWLPSYEHAQLWIGAAAGTGFRWNLRLVYLPIPFLLAVCGLAFLLLAWYQRRLVEPGHCHACGYDLTGNISGRCPECGTGAEVRAGFGSAGAPAAREGTRAGTVPPRQLDRCSRRT